MGLVHKVDRFLRQERLLQPGDAVCVAVSGGPDSMALLHVLHRLSAQWDFKLLAAHFNHRFRGEESDREALLVERFAHELGLPCEIGAADVPAYAREESLNPQAAAREKRYQFLYSAAKRFGADKIALAHHGDDQAETLIMRLLRGTGPSGLAGIPTRRRDDREKAELVRPLMRIYKQEILDYCEQWNIPFCSDSSNQSRKYFRNEVRLDVLPFLKRYNRRLAESLNRLADMMGAEDDYLRQMAEEAFVRLGHRENGGVRFSRKAFSALHVALQRRIITLILNYLWNEQRGGQPPWEYIDVEAIRSAILQDRKPSLNVNLKSGIRLERTYDTIRFTLSPMEMTPPFFRLLPEIRQGEGECPIPEIGMVLRYRLLENGEKFLSRLPTSEREVFFDADRICFPLSVRSRKHGDRMEVFGLNGSKKVKNIFMDEKIPPSERNRTPLLCDAENKVLWIPGVRRSRHAPVSEETARVLYMECLYAAENPPERGK